MIEISRNKLEIAYRQNPFNPRCVDWRFNRPYEKWQHYDNYKTTMEAIEALMQLIKEAKERK